MTLEQRNELLKKNIHMLLMRENLKGLNTQDKYLKNKMLREMYGNHSSNCKA